MTTTHDGDGADDIVGGAFAEGEARVELGDFGQRIEARHVRRRRARAAALGLVVLAGGLFAALFGGRVLELVGRRMDLSAANTDSLLHWALLLLSAGVVLEAVLEAVAGRRKRPAQIDPAPPRS